MQRKAFVQKTRKLRAHGEDRKCMKFLLQSAASDGMTRRPRAGMLRPS